MKNFKLLLASTAILSTGALAVLATPSTAPQSVTAQFGADIVIVEPALMTGGNISFPTMLATGGRVVTVDATGAVDSSSTATFADPNPTASVNPIIISGADIGSMYDDSNGADTSFDINNYSGWSQIQMPPKITLTDVSTNQSGKCGDVTGFTPGTPSFGKDIMEEGGSEVRTIRFPYGATFTMKEGFHPENGYANCKGSATVTYIPYTY